MTRSLSVFLPVHNAQQSLEALVASLLEVLQELTPRFDVLLIDDASNDDTLATADELARAYPQVRVVSHAPRQGRAGALRSGLSHSQGEVVLLRDETSDLDLHDVRKLWRLIDDYDAVLGRPGEPPAEASRGWGDWIAEGVGLSVGQAGGGAALATLLLLRRHVAQRMRLASLRMDELRGELARLGCRWCETPVRRIALPRGPANAGPHLRTRRRRWGTSANRAVAAACERPDYLRSIRDFALGE